MSDRYKIPPVIDYELKFVKMQFLRKIDIIYDNNKQRNYEIDKIWILCDLDLLLKIWHQERIVWCLANNLREK